MQILSHLKKKKKWGYIHNNQNHKQHIFSNKKGCVRYYSTNHHIVIRLLDITVLITI